MTSQRQHTASQIGPRAAARDRRTAAASCPRTGCCPTCPCTSASSPTASPKPTAGAASSTMSPPGGWPSGWPPGRSSPTSPAAWSASSTPERSTPTLKTQLRIHARSGTYPDQPQAARLMDYCTNRGAALGPVGQDFGAACDQIDRADLMLADLHERARHGGLQPPSRPGQRPTAPGSSPWPAGTPRPRRSASSWTPPPPTSPCSPSPRTPTSARPTSARSSNSARACPKAPTAGATARPSPPAKPGSPPGSAPSSRPTARPPSAAPRTRRRSPPGHSVLLSFRPAGRSIWRPSRDPRECGHQRRARRERPASPRGSSSGPAVAIATLRSDTRGRR